MVLQDFFRVADCVERSGTGTERADPQIAETVDDAAGRGEVGKVLGEELGARRDAVLAGKRVGNVVLAEVVAGRHFAAEAVTAVLDLHGLGAIGRGLDQHGNLKPGEADSVDDGAFFTEVGQGDDDAVDGVGVLLEELGAAAGVIGRLHGTMLGLLRREDN